MSGEAEQLALELDPEQLTPYEAAMAHKWWRKPCGACGAQAGRPCAPIQQGNAYGTIHGVRT